MPSPQMIYQDVNNGPGWGGPTRDWQAISDDEQSYRSEPHEATPGRARLHEVLPQQRPRTYSKEYTHMDINARDHIPVPQVAVRNSNFNPSEAGIDNRRGVWRMPTASVSFLGALSPATSNMLQIGGVVAGVLVLVAGIAMYRNRQR